MINSTIIINFYGGPGTGKSTMAAFVFAELKNLGYNVELVTEYAKDMTWQESFNVLTNQIYVFGKQQNRIWRLMGKVDFIITDAPILNSIVYNTGSRNLNALVVEEYQKYFNFDIFLDRVKAYNPSGRSQTYNEALRIDSKTRRVLELTRSQSQGWCDLQAAGHKDSLPLILNSIITFKNGPYITEQSQEEIREAL